MAYERLKLAENGICRMSSKRVLRDNKRCLTPYILCFVVLICATLTISVKAEVETESGGTDDVESAVAEEKVYRLSPPGEDPRMRHLLAGEEFFHSRKLKEAREEFGKALNLDSQNARAHYFLGLIEYEEGNTQEASTRFRIAHECLDLSQMSPQPPVGAKQVQVEFPDGYEARMYYRDGWYVSPKDPAVVHRSIHPLEANSTYRIELKPKNRRSWVRTGIVGLIVAFSFFMAR